MNDRGPRRVSLPLKRTPRCGYCQIVMASLTVYGCGVCRGLFCSRMCVAGHADHAAASGEPACLEAIVRPPDAAKGGEEQKTG